MLTWLRFAKKLGRARIGFTFCLPMVLAAGILTASAQARRPRALDRRINAVLDASPARRGFWGIVVAQVRGGKILYSLNGSHLFQPASNLKLFTAAAALQDLGPDFTTLTTVESASLPDAQGRVGNLYIVGRGDANFASSRVLPYAGPNAKKNPQLPLQAIADLARQIAAHGVRKVTGNLIADDSYFIYDPYPPDWAADDLAWGYGAPVTALVFNDNTLLLEIVPGPTTGSKPRATLEPEVGEYMIENHLSTAAPDVKGEIEIDHDAGPTWLGVWGNIPAGAPAEDETIAVLHPSQVIGNLLREDLKKQGIPVEGNVEVCHLLRGGKLALSQASPFAAAPAPATNRDVLAIDHSLPLRDDVTLTLKVSQNLHAEIWLRLLGRKIEGQGSRAAGLEALRSFAGGLGIAPDELEIVDGSGLSRQDLVAPQAIVTLLLSAARAPFAQDFYNALPVAGIDGTLSNRFKGTPLAGRMRAKTGTIEHVNSLSGYMDMSGGRRLAFSIIGNADPLKSSQADALIDRIALTIFEYYSKRLR